MGLYIEVAYQGDWWGEDPLTETIHETTGSLFRSLAGMRPHRGEQSRPWEALGRCTGKIYIDVAGSSCELCHKASGAHEFRVGTNPITTRWIKPNAEYPNGALTTDGTHYYQAERRQVGWVFVARNPAPTSRADEALKDTGLREAWVTVYDSPPEVVVKRTEHYADFGTGASA